jgi:hypothetical protein
MDSFMANGGGQPLGSLMSRVEEEPKKQWAGRGGRPGNRRSVGGIGEEALLQIA